MGKILNSVLYTIPKFIFRFDSYKDSDGNGIFIRFIKTIITEIDDFVIGYTDKDLYNQHIPIDYRGEGNEVDPRMIGFLAQDLGSFPNFTNTSPGFKIILANLWKFYREKGTQAGLNALFNPLGYDPVFTIVTNSNDVIHDGDDIDHDSILNSVEIIHDSACSRCISGILVLNQIPDSEPTILTIPDVEPILQLIFPVYVRATVVFINVTFDPLMESDGTPIQDITDTDIYHITNS